MPKVGVSGSPGQHRSRTVKKDNTPSDLPEIAKEIVLALLDGDWARYSDDSGKNFYYIIRERDHGIEVNDRHAFDNMLALGKYDPDAFERWYIQAALAEEPPDRLARARKRVVKAGVDPAFFDAMIESRAPLEKLLPPFVRNENWDELNAVLEAVRIERTRQQHIFVSQSDRPGLRKALEARFLKELIERFPSVVKRAEGFEWLPFSDPQLREAIRCYLYGFFRAAILLAVAAIESRLKKIAVVERPDNCERLVDLVFGDAGVCGKDAVSASALKELFRLRNKVAHDGADPKREAAEKALDLVRSISETLTQRFDEVA